MFVIVSKKLTLKQTLEYIYNLFTCATFDALKYAESPRMIASKRGKKVGDLVGRRRDGASAPEAIDTAS